MESVVALATSVVLFGTAIIGYFKIRNRTQEIHVMVNSRLLQEQDWNDSLAEALQRAGIEVPPRPPRDETGQSK